MLTIQRLVKRGHRGVEQGTLDLTTKEDFRDLSQLVIMFDVPVNSLTPTVAIRVQP